jgi:hypothetical protein
MDFVKEISAEKRRLKELRYSLYVSSKAFAIHDNKKKLLATQPLSTDENTILHSPYESILMLTISGIQRIINMNEPKDYPHIKIIVTSDDVYINNVIQEWLNKWKVNNFEDRPNQTLLQQLHDLVQTVQVDNLRVSMNECPSLQLVK